MGTILGGSYDNGAQGENFSMPNIFKIAWKSFKWFQDNWGTISLLGIPAMLIGVWGFWRHLKDIEIFVIVLNVFFISICSLVLKDKFWPFLVFDFSERGIVLRFLQKRLKEAKKLEKHPELEKGNHESQMPNFFNRFLDYRDKMDYFFRHWCTVEAQCRFTKYYSDEVNKFKKIHDGTNSAQNNYFGRILHMDISQLESTIWKIEREDVPKQFDVKVIPWLKRNS